MHKKTKEFSLKIIGFCKFLNIFYRLNLKNEKAYGKKKVLNNIEVNMGLIIINYLNVDMLK